MENQVKKREQLKEYKVGNKYKDISKKSRKKKKEKFETQVTKYKYTIS